MEGKTGLALAPGQADAVRAALSSKASVITGGPGVGNPKTGEPAPVSPRRVAVFRPSGILKRRVEKGVVGTEEAA